MNEQEIRAELSVSISLFLSLSLFLPIPFSSKKFVCLRVNFVKDNLPVDKMEGTARHLLSFRVVYVGNLNRWKKEAGPFREVESRLSTRQREKKGGNLVVA